MTNIAIIGTGRMAQGLGVGWVKAGHQVLFGSRNPAEKSRLVSKIGYGASVTLPAAAVTWADVVVLAIPFAQVKTFAREHAPQLVGKLVIDISNPFDQLPDNRISGAELTAAAIGDGARVVAAFKDNFWETLSNPDDPGGLRRDVHFAGDNDDDKQRVTQLVTDLGFRPVDCGPLKYARALDAMVPLLVELDHRLNDSRHNSSWKFLSK